MILCKYRSFCRYENYSRSELFPMRARNSVYDRFDLLSCTYELCVTIVGLAQNPATVRRICSIIRLTCMTDYVRYVVRRRLSPVCSRSHGGVSFVDINSKWPISSFHLAGRSILFRIIDHQSTLMNSINNWNPQGQLCKITAIRLIFVAITKQNKMTTEIKLPQLGQ